MTLWTIGSHHNDHDYFAVVLGEVERFAIAQGDGNIGTLPRGVLREADLQQAQKNDKTSEGNHKL
ncbi:MAG TPA: hypothetical protein VNU44_06360 [Bryobacteraceae bacterium]|nr:hypothetical protein [Bryobacteraceae bacterium]